MTCCDLKAAVCTALTTGLEVLVLLLVEKFHLSVNKKHDSYT